MALGSERSPHERETLVFPSPEEATTWREQVLERLRSQEHKGVRKRRELVAQELAREFERHGEGVGMIIRPWEHTPEEHAEVQQLVDLAFARDLTAALKQAKASGYYPRNIDLFHDVLTTEMYQQLRDFGLHRQPLAGWLMLAAGVVVAVLILVLWLALF